jgi:hypothetical protein
LDKFIFKFWTIFLPKYNMFIVIWVLWTKFLDFEVFLSRIRS